MNKFKLLSATALTVVVLAASAPAMATEDKGWFETVKQSVNSWFSDDTQATPNNAFLDEVTLAVPPMTAEDAASIQPAAGNYEETVTMEIEGQEQSSYAPGSMQYEAPVVSEAQVDVFENIAPAAGEETTDAVDMAVEASEMAVEANAMANEAGATAKEAAKVAEEAAEKAVEASAKAEEKVEETTEEAVEEADDMAHDHMNDEDNHDHEHMNDAE